MRYPEGNPRGKDLFRALEHRVEKKVYDDEFLLLLIEYQRMYPQSEHFDIFMPGMPHSMGITGWHWNMQKRLAGSAWSILKYGSS